MKHRKSSDNAGTNPDLELFFSASRKAAPMPSAGLMERVLQDGVALQPAPRGLERAHARPKPGFSRLWAAFGGWVPASALTACLMVGLLLGYAAPDSVGTVTDAVLNSAGVTVSDTEYTTLDDLVTEG